MSCRGRLLIGLVTALLCAGSIAQEATLEEQCTLSDGKVVDECVQGLKDASGAKNYYDQQLAKQRASDALQRARRELAGASRIGERQGSFESRCTTGRGFVLKDCVAALRQAWDEKDVVLRLMYEDRARTIQLDNGIIPKADQDIAYREAAQQDALKKAEKARSDARTKARQAVLDQCKADGLTMGRVKIGMSSEQALRCGWGKPERVNRTINARGTFEQWVYRVGQYLYFDNGVLTSIQQ